MFSRIKVVFAVGSINVFGGRRRRGAEKQTSEAPADWLVYADSGHLLSHFNAKTQSIECE
jgi:hypothetical protein